MAQELKAKSSGEIRARDALFGYWWYEKSEVDAVIEELKIKVKVKTYDIEAARKLNISYLSDYAEALKRESHHKYKRCLAMAKWCFTKSNYHFVLARHGEDVKENNRKSILYSKWRERWLELAEKFKEAK